jgi:cytidine deaminase
MLDERTIEEMIRTAKQAMTRAYTPVSGFPVGAALLTPGQAVYPGCNTESIIAGLGACAERSAVDHAVIHGETAFTAVLVASRSIRPLYPCGACRQYLFEFAEDPQTFMVYALGADGRLEAQRLVDLLPQGFGPREKAAADGQGLDGFGAKKV